MNAPVLTYSLTPGEPRGSAGLAGVRLRHAVVTDAGETVSEGTDGTVVGVWAEGAAYEVEVASGLATVDAASLKAV